ncbi:MAG TPA: SMP-30/gluconolactonase/LRE family protein [Caulobacteraceae bacterium]|jgi:gluconolactonase|nr:SMP-30/gluconolactonase/LRE family protein [Caulobacteraceae bacterium]
MQEIATGYGLIEGPVWDAARGLYFSDVRDGGVNLLGRDGTITQVVPKRRGVGGMALHAAGGLVISGRDISYAPLDGREGKVLLTAQASGGIGFNDLTTDRNGRIYVGSLAFRVFGGEAPKPGQLHVIDLDASSRALSGGVMLTNGLGFSPDGTRLYHSDSRAPGVRVYDVAADGSVGPWRLFANLGAGSTPDGLKVAADGSVWVADARGGRVAVFAPDGDHRMDVAVPLPMVTSLCFGGDDLRDLYVVTGSDGGPSESCATIFRMRTDVAGLPLAPARVAV